MENQEITVYVATHKQFEYDLPCGYQRMQVNCFNLNQHWDGYVHDDVGENISIKNPNYCELTVLYSAWKNCKASIKGLVHYRRFFCNDEHVSFISRLLADAQNLKQDIIGKEDIERLIGKEKFDVILAMPQGPYPRTAEEELSQFCYRKDIDKMIKIVARETPEYVEALNAVLASHHLSYFNMMIANHETFDNYCEWIFKILSAVEIECDISKYDKQHARLFGYLSEVLLNVYFYNSGKKIKYLNIVQPYQFMENNREPYQVQQRRRKQYELLRKINLFSFVEFVYRLKNPKVYAQYISCKENIRRTIKL